MRAAVLRVLRAEVDVEGAGPEIARPLFDALSEAVSALGVSVVTGRFGAAMKVSWVNDGPVTLLLDTKEGL